MKVRVKTETIYLVDLPIKSFDEICTDNMSLKESDELIEECIYEQFKCSIDYIINVTESKINY